MPRLKQPPPGEATACLREIPPPVAAVPRRKRHPARNLPSNGTGDGNDDDDGGGEVIASAKPPAASILDSPRNTSTEPDDRRRTFMTGSQRTPRTELYTNDDNVAPYWYARPFECSRAASGPQVLDLGETNITALAITGIPDGVPPELNVATVPHGEPRRLYYFSQVPLDDRVLRSLDAIYGGAPYPLPTLDDRAVGQAAVLPEQRYPTCNFYATEGIPSAASRFVEYRYLQQIHVPSQITVDTHTGTVHRIGALPEWPIPLVVVMPENFILQTRHTGYFEFDRPDLIVRVYSRRALTAKRWASPDDSNPVNDLTVGTLRDDLFPIVEQFFTRLGLNRIVRTADQIYAHNQYILCVVGSIANLALYVPE